MNEKEHQRAADVEEARAKLLECSETFIKEVFDRTLSSPDRKVFHDLNPKAEHHGPPVSYICAHRMIAFSML